MFSLVNFEFCKSLFLKNSAVREVYECLFEYVFNVCACSSVKQKMLRKILLKTIVWFFVFSTSISSFFRKINRSNFTYSQEKCVIIFVYISRFCILAAYVVTSVIMWIFDRLYSNNTYLYIYTSIYRGIHKG